MNETIILKLDIELKSLKRQKNKFKKIIKF